MFLFVEYLPDIHVNEKTKETISNSKLVVGTPIGMDEGKPKMAKLNTFEKDQADLMYGMLVGVDEQGEIKNIEKEKENIENGDAR